MQKRGGRDEVHFEKRKCKCTHVHLLENMLLSVIMKKPEEIEEKDIWRLHVESVCLGMTKHPWLGMSGDSGPHERERSATRLNPGLRSHDTVDAIELLDS